MKDEKQWSMSYVKQQLTLAIPFTVGGGIRTLDDMKRILRAGADKVRSTHRH